LGGAGRLVENLASVPERLYVHFGKQGAAKEHSADSAAILSKKLTPGAALRARSL
jgi:hypothetical protein